MSTSITFNGSSYIVPAIADASWGTNVSNYLIAIASGCLQKSGGAFTLSAADVDFGGTYGLKAVYFKSKTTNIASAGVLVLAKTDAINWRNNANSADLSLSINGSDQLIFNSIVLSDTSSSQTFTNKKLSDSTVTFVNVSDATKVLKMSLGSATTGTTTTFSFQQSTNRTVTWPDATDTVQLLAAAQSPTNKTFDNTNVYTTKVANFTLQDGSDATKQFNFVASSITTGTTRSLTVPDVSGTLVLLAATQSPTNKTFDNTNQMTLKSNKFTLQDSTDTTKQVTFDLSGITTGHTSVLKSPELNGTDTLVMLAASQTLTNKTLTSPTLTTPVLGTPSSGTLTSCTGLPISSGVSGLGTGVATFLATPSSANLLSALTTSTGNGSAVFGSGPTIDSALLTTNAQLRAAAPLKWYNSGNTHFVAFQAGTLSGDTTWTLPTGDGSANQLLSTNGSGVLSWASAISSSLNQFNVSIGDSSNVAQSTNTNLVGNVKASYSTATITVTIAAPGVVTDTGHGLNTGDKVYFTTTGALPTGLSVSTTYFVNKIDANSYNLSTTLANAVAGTNITTSGSQSGTHSRFSGGIKFLDQDARIPGKTSGNNTTTGYVGEVVSSAVTTASSSGVTAGQFGNVTSISLTPGHWVVYGTIMNTRAGGQAELTFAVSTSSGNTTTDHVNGNNVFTSTMILTGTGNMTFPLPPWDQSLSVATTIYLKAKMDGGTWTQSNFWGKLIAYRVD